MDNPDVHDFYKLNYFPKGTVPHVGHPTYETDPPPAGTTYNTNVTGRNYSGSWASFDFDVFYWEGNGTFKRNCTRYLSGGDDQFITENNFTIAAGLYYMEFTLRSASMFGGGAYYLPFEQGRQLYTVRGDPIGLKGSGKRVLVPRIVHFNQDTILSLGGDSDYNWRSVVHVVIHAITFNPSRATPPQTLLAGLKYTPEDEIDNHYYKAQVYASNVSSPADLHLNNEQYVLEGHAPLPTPASLPIRISDGYWLAYVATNPSTSEGHEEASTYSGVANRTLEAYSSEDYKLLATGLDFRTYTTPLTYSHRAFGCRLSSPNPSISSLTSTFRDTTYDAPFRKQHVPLVYNVGVIDFLTGELGVNGYAYCMEKQVLLSPDAGGTVIGGDGQHAGWVATRPAKAVNIIHMSIVSTASGGLTDRVFKVVTGAGARWNLVGQTNTVYLSQDCPTGIVINNDTNNDISITAVDGKSIGSFSLICATIGG